MKANVVMEEDYGLLTKEGVMPLIGVDVTGDIVGKTARIKVRQHFRNESSRPVEAIYKFPLPEGASVCGFMAEVEDRVFTGAIEEREKAYEIYDDAIHDGDGGFLLDQERPNIFTLSVGNMKPKTSAVITIDYVTLLDTSKLQTRVLLPTTVSPRYVPRDTPDRDGIPVHSLVNPPFVSSTPYGLTLDLAIHGKAYITSIESPSHSIRVDMSGEVLRVGFATEVEVMDRDFVLVITRKEEFVDVGYFVRDPNGVFFQVDLFPKPSSAGACAEPARDVFFVIDCSGSMQGSSITQAKKALEIFLRGMGKGVNFNIIRFGNDYRMLFPGCVPYSSKTLQEALAYLEATEANLGGTELLRPLREIYSQRTGEPNRRSIVVITDGEIGNEGEVIALVQRHAATTRVFLVGIGYGPNEYLLKQIARVSNGAAELISQGERIESRLLKLFNKVALSTNPVTGLTIETGRSVDQAPALPVVYEGDCTSVFGMSDNNLSTHEQITLLGVTRNVQREWSVPLHEVPRDKTPIPLLWAREKIRDLQEGLLEPPAERGELPARQKKVEKEIIRLSRRFGIISGYTSFVAMEERREPDKTFDSMVTVTVPVMLTKDWGGTVRPNGPRPSWGMPEPCFMMREPDVMFKLQGREPVAESAKEILMTEILSRQRAEGGFEVDDELARKLDLPFDVRKIAERILTATDVDKFTLLSTAIIMAVLEEDMGDIRDCWEGVIGKSKAWFASNLHAGAPTIDGMHLTRWVRHELFDIVRM